MKFPFGYSVLTVALATMAIFLTSAGIMYTRTQGSRSVTSHVIDVNTIVREHSSVDVVETSHQSEISKFAKKHQHELKAARKDRKRECGSIISVSAIDCDICVLIVEGLSDLVAKGSTQEDIVKFSTEACIELEIEDARVCPAVVQQFKNELFGVVLRLSYSPKEVCSYILGTNCGDPFNPFTMWNVTFPDVPKPPVVPPSLPKPGSPRLRVLHLTDFHLDKDYTVGSNTDCGEPLCCRAADGPPVPGVPGAGKYGAYSNCDSAPITVDSLFRHLKSIQDEFDYVIFTGDIPAHNIWNQTRSDQTSAMDVFTKYMKTYLPNKIVYNTLGNHESSPVDSFPPPFVTGNDSEAWLYNNAAKNWLNWLPAATETTIKKAGFYSLTQHFLGLKIISLNMNMCNSGNWWLYINATDPADMLQWFISELQAAEDAGLKVHVLGHIYPGCSCCLKPWSWNYYKIINRYESTIVEQFFGHTHAMTYQMFYDEETSQRPLGVTYMPGSITTYSNLNPGFRIYEIDGNYTGSSWRVQDYTNYFLNLTHANLYGEVTWQKEYSAKDSYKMTSLFPKDWNDLIYRMKADDTLFQIFCRHNSKSAPTKCSTCTGDCKKNFLCGLKTGRNGDPDICDDL
ncbi:sphingomyelin phosphodiesterase-like [Ruditapes philippinarum]|uniref:sphingomyelin phosphodiesterase-like n=1 Tax=Ruditapes philippinarum TaxID=129788 RepID=UPI00295AE86B|nr:sphingomyelin phosphodiesterase-like [Ruditapes philippinarum]